MTSITATALRQNIHQTIGEDNWAAIEEPLYLSSIPGSSESLIDDLDASLKPVKNLGDRKQYGKNENKHRTISLMI